MRRHWGQHFLVDSRVLDGMMDAAPLKASDTVLEIGPGKGALTERLLATSAQVVAIERDRRLVGFLLERWSGHPRFRLVEGDALRVDWRGLGLTDGGYVVVANIPYSITTPLIEKFLESPRPVWVELMIQKDVALRLMASAGDGARGALSVIVQQTFEIKSVMSVPRSAFVPPPAVESAVILMTPRAGVVDPAFCAFIRDCFRHRRKMLLSTLKILDRSIDWAHTLEALGIPATARPQELSNEQWQRLYESIRITSESIRI